MFTQRKKTIEITITVTTNDLDHLICYCIWFGRMFFLYLLWHLKTLLILHHKYWAVRENENKIEESQKQIFVMAHLRIKKPVGTVGLVRLLWIKIIQLCNVENRYCFFKCLWEVSFILNNALSPNYSHFKTQAMCMITDVRCDYGFRRDSNYTSQRIVSAQTELHLFRVLFLNKLTASGIWCFLSFLWFSLLVGLGYIAV